MLKTNIISIKIISRRKLLFYYISYFSFFLLYPKQQMIKWESSLSLPAPMNQGLCYSYLEKAMNTNKLINLETEMDKQILLKQVQFNKNKVKFTYIFKSKTDYQYWAKTSYKHLNTKYINNTNYYITVKYVTLGQFSEC